MYPYYTLTTTDHKSSSSSFTDSDVVSLQTRDTSMETLDTESLKMMPHCGLDPKMLEYCGLDPKKTMDFVLFQDVRFEFLFPSGSHESMARFVRHMESKDTKRVPPLSVIFYNDLLESTWCWDRLLPWTSGYVLFEDYFSYLERFFHKNASSVPNLCTAATECVFAGDELIRTIGALGKRAAFTDDHGELSLKIKDKANHLIDPPTVSADATFSAACLMCITEEAKLMSKVYTWWTIEDDKASAELFQNIFKFSNEVRKAAFDILTTYRGPYSMQVSASMLGLKREAAYALELLQRYNVEHEEKFEICEEIRDLTLELFRIILNFFPKDCEIKYCPIDHARDMMRKWRAEHLAKPSKDSVCADEVSPVNLDEIAIPNTPTTSKRTVPAAPSSWSEQDNTNNKKMKSMASSQGRNSPLDDVRKFMDETEKKALQENYRKTQQFGEVDVGVVVKERDELKDEVEVLRNEVSVLKQLQKSQADIMKARQQKWDDERDALKEEKKRLKCTMYDLFKAFDGLKENVKKIKALRDE